jgi:hypothetical protein
MAQMSVRGDCLRGPRGGMRRLVCHRCDDVNEFVLVVRLGFSGRLIGANKARAQNAIFKFYEWIFRISTLQMTPSEDRTLSS